MATQNTERDYPVGSPFAADYDGKSHKPAISPLLRDFPVGHPKAADSAANLVETAARIADDLRLHPPGAALQAAVPSAPTLAEVLAAGEQAINSGA
jgi:hypothetical protein